MLVLAFDARLEEPEWLPVLRSEAPAAIVNELDRLLEAVEVDVACRRIVVLEVQVVAYGAPLVVFVRGFEHKEI